MIEHRAQFSSEAARPTAGVPPSPVAGWARLGDLPAPSERALRSVYHLTPAEALLAQGLAVGESLEEVARRVGIRITTARTQLASIFAKTATRRQTKLVAMLCHLAHIECRRRAPESFIPFT